jgi:hypothetical protein
MIIPSVLLVFIPFNGAAINLFLRQMRDMSELTLGTYTILAMIVAYIPSCLIGGINELKTFYPVDWSMAVLLGFTTSSMHILKAKSLKYEEPARLAVLNYF